MLNPLLLLVATTALCDGGKLLNPLPEVSERLFSWLRSDPSFYLHPNLTLRHEDGRYGLFASGDVASISTVLSVPSSLQTSVEKTSRVDQDLCTLSSKFNKKDSPHRAFWDSRPLLPPALSMSAMGLEMLRSMLIDVGNGQSLLPPLESTNWHDDYECEGIGLVAGVGRDRAMTPMYDLIRRVPPNGDINSRTRSLFNGVGIEVVATRDISKGEELLIHFEKSMACIEESCNEEEPKKSAGDETWAWTASEIFKYYGTAGGHPQKWSLNMVEMEASSHSRISEHRVEFELEEDGTLRWRVAPPKEVAVELMHHDVRRLENFLHEELLPAREELGGDFEVLSEYLGALTRALVLALEATCGDCEEYENQEIYSERESMGIDKYYGSIYQCETLVYALQGFKTVDVVQSTYQTITYREREGDICMWLDKVYQMCGSYWPHYHEMVVHKTAKYLDRDPRRALWVGGGDSGLLEELLKYPSLELAVGLELDQKVTRSSFQNFGRDPNYQDPRVEWWYGDASKSLLLLPRSYFGTFDLILVDLSDTIFSLEVSKDFNVIETLSLLLAPGGIFEMNEMFFETISEVFQHTIHYRIPNVPKVCDQSLIIASHDVNFLQRELNQWDLPDIIVENSYYKTNHQFQHVHDYKHNPDDAFSRLSLQEENELQQTSPGVLLVVDVQNLTNAITLTQMLAMLESTGFQVLSSVQNAHNAHNDTITDITQMTIFAKQGYVNLVIWNQTKYCAVDIKLWSEFHLQDKTKAALVHLLGGHHTASYRIVTAGMFGVDTWKEDELARGPNISSLVEAKEDACQLEDAPQGSLMDHALGRGLELLQSTNITAIIVCGETCPSPSLLAQAPSIQHIVTLRTCEKLTPLSALADAKMFNECRAKLDQTLRDSLSSQPPVGLILVGDITKSMAGLFVALFRRRSTSPQDLTNQQVLMLSTSSGPHQAWRKSFMETFKEKVFKNDPLFTAQLDFKDQNDAIELHVLSFKDSFFIQHLTRLLSDPNPPEIQHVWGGLWRPSPKVLDEGTVRQPRPASPSELFSETALRHHQAQTHLGHQTLLQFRAVTPFREGERVRAKFEGNGIHFPAVVASVGDGSYSLLYDDGDEEEDVDPSFIQRIDPATRRFSAEEHMLVEAAIREAYVVIYATVGFDETPTSIPTSVSARTGEGRVVSFSSGDISAILSWDGRNALDLLLFTFFQSAKIVEMFEKEILRAVPGLEKIHHDEQPRGTGGIVSYMFDLEDYDQKRIDPIWAVHEPRV